MLNLYNYINTLYECFLDDCDIYDHGVFNQLVVYYVQDAQQL